ncbi:MAG: helix-turn-helix domain-containing protein [Treponema sp.]|jgi:transcriptional regulator with XRE-family HTH domain|nr:helix-turn-helix domain-containing protein [Treponema sp.]
MTDYDDDYDEDEPQIEAQIRRIAARIREERKKAGLSQMTLSLQAGLSQNQVFCIETGKRIPNLYTVLRICEALRINPAVLFDNTEDERQRDRETIIRLVSKYV